MSVQFERESRIDWLVELDPMPRYLRETVCVAPFRSRRPAAFRMPGGTVAIAELDDSATSINGRFHRRVWHIASHDPSRAGQASPYHEGGCPVEAVDPSTIKAGQPSQQNASCAEPDA